MPELSKITLPSGTTYTFKDAIARAAVAGGVTFLGVTTTPLEDGSTITTLVIDGENVEAINGGIVIYNGREFIYSESQGIWHEIGSTGDLGELAYKDDASASYTPSGVVSQPTFTGTSTTSTGTFTPTGSVSTPTFTGTEGSVDVTGTPSGTISSGAGATNYTPAGTVSTPTITVTPTTVTKYVANSASGGGTVSAGSAAECTLPSLKFTVNDETLKIDWADGSFTANVPTEVTLPSFSSQVVATGIDTATSTQPTFTGTGTSLKFTGDTLSSTGKFTPAGSVSQPTFTGNEGNVSVNGTPSGTVSQPTFVGDTDTIVVS